MDSAAEGTDLNAYKESLWDPKKLTLDGEPTWWTIRPMTRPQIRWAQTLRHEPVECADFITRVGLVKVENYTLEGSHGEVRNMPPIAVKKEGKLGDIITDEWMNEVQLQTDIISGLSIMIQSISEVHVPLSRPSAPPSGAQT